MKTLFVGIVILLGLSACSTHKDNFYDRANNASEKSLNGLEKDTSK